MKIIISISKVMQLSLFIKRMPKVFTGKSHKPITKTYGYFSNCIGQFTNTGRHYRMYITFYPRPSPGLLEFDLPSTDLQESLWGRFSGTLGSADYCCDTRRLLYSGMGDEEIRW